MYVHEQLLTRPVISGEAPGICYLFHLSREARLLKTAALPAQPLDGSWLSPEHEGLAHAQLRYLYPLSIPSTEYMSLTVVHVISHTRLFPFFPTIFNESNIKRGEPGDKARLLQLYIHV